MTQQPDLELTHFRFDVDRVGVATVLFDRSGESMNTLSPEIFADFATIIDRCESDIAIRAIVVGSAKPGSFIAGGDIRWLQTLDDPATAAELANAGQHVLGRLEALDRDLGKPVVAAIHGPCLGGGLEIALACGQRVATDDPATHFGQPEIKLGLIPGAGGTQRLPRLVGISAGLDLILTGRSIRPGRALHMGLVDALCPPEELMQTARRRAAGAITTAPTGRRRSPWARIRAFADVARWRTAALESNPLGRKVLFDQAEKIMLRRTKGHYPAAPAALRAVRAGIERGRETGYATEAEEFVAVLASPEAQALISIFFATQGLKRESGVASDVEPRQIDHVGVIGGGLMGAGIGAVNLMRAGVATAIKEIDDGGVARALAHIEQEVKTRAQRVGKRPSEIASIEHLLSGTTEYSELAEADLVIEAVFEDLTLKRAVLAAIEGATSESAIFASNTSSIPIGEIAAEARRPQNVIGMHYFSPVERMPLLEIVTTEATSDETTATCVEFGKRQGKTVIVVNDGAGFYTTRILAPYAAEVLHLLRDGAAIGDIDDALVDWGFPVGPITLSDEVGIDVGAKIAVILEEAFGDRMKAPADFTALVDDGRKGRKNGRGFYRYEGGKRRGVDETVYDVLGVSPTGKIGREEIQDRLVLQMINEAARCLEDGILRSARDGDVGAIMGLGFPPFRGGPFFYVDRAGAKDIVGRMDRLADAYGSRFEPAAILRDQAAAGGKFRGGS